MKTCACALQFSTDEVKRDSHRKLLALLYVDCPFEIIWHDVEIDPEEDMCQPPSRLRIDYE